MGRSIVPVLIALAAVSATLRAQSHASPAGSLKVRPHAIGFGMVATLGAYWQMQALEVGYARRPERGLASISLSTRLGTFINESSMMGGNKGVLVGLTLAGRTRMKSIAQFGEAERGTGIGFDLTFELSAYTAAGSPMAQGSRWAAVSVLPAFSVGTGDAPHFAIVLGPTLLLSHTKAAMRGLLSFRGEAPLARRESRP